MNNILMNTLICHKSIKIIQSNMIKMKNAILNWSGGKDCSFALFKLRAEEPDLNIRLLTTFDEQQRKVSMHGTGEKFIDRQAESLGLDLHKVFLPAMPGNHTYEKIMRESWENLKSEGFEYSVFGDIFLEELRSYREKMSAKMDIKALFPLWLKDTKQLAGEFIDSGFKAVIISASDQFFDKDVLGTGFDRNFLNRLPDEVDACGENGEFHTFVYDGPGFKSPVRFSFGETVIKKFPSPVKANEEAGFWFLDLTAR
jgi:uncharacterized protein (TIGR00290 family)